MSEQAINMETLNALLALVQAGNSGGRRKGRRSGGFGASRKSTPEESEARRKANDEECIKVFKAAGYKVVEPRFNVLTYNKWIAKGRKVKAGQKGHQVGPFNLFHEDQTEPLTTTVGGVEAKLMPVVDKLATAKVEPPKETPKPIPAPAKPVEATKTETAHYANVFDWNK